MDCARKEEKENQTMNSFIALTNSINNFETRHHRL